MYTPPVFMMLDLVFWRESRNAMVRSRMPNAHGLMLSINAATPIRGRSHLPSLLKFQRAVVPMFPVLRKITDPNSNTAIPTRIQSFLFILRYGVTVAEN